MTAAEPRPIVYVVDDDAGVRSAVALLLKSMGQPSATFGSAWEFLAAYEPDQPGCVLLDVRMPGMSGLELQGELNRRGVLLPVIFITGHGDVPMAVEAMQHGAFDFLQKPFKDHDLTGRIRRALAHDRELREKIGRKTQIRARLARLTPRERQVLRLVADGKPNKVMAAELGVSQRTVEIHRAHVMRKMGASSLAQLVRMMLVAAA